MGNSVEYISRAPNAGGDKIYLLASDEPDEVDLGGLLADLIGQWRMLALICLAGITASALFAFTTGGYAVEQLLRRPTVHELGSLTRQDLVDSSTNAVFDRFVDILASPEVHTATLASSGLVEPLREQSGLSDEQIARNVFEHFALSLVEHEHYQLQKNERVPVTEIRASLVTGDPQWAVEYLDALVANGQAEAKRMFTEDVAAVRSARIDTLRARIAALSAAEARKREAAIERLVEANDEAIAALQQQIDTRLKKARLQRQNQIVRLGEALRTAENLGIREPVTWDDLRPLAKSSQVINELGDAARSNPLYFRGTRLLDAELQQLQARTSDRPFVDGLVDLENEIEKKRNDVKVTALKSRSNDEIYIEEYSALQRELSELLRQPTDFPDATFAVVTQPATLPQARLRSPWVTIAAGTLVAAVIAVLIALLRLSVSRARGRAETPADAASLPAGQQ